jgi:hypothetical protein
VRSMFSSFGPLSEVVLLRQKDEQAASKGSAFVKFLHKESADAAVRALDKKFRDKVRGQLSGRQGKFWRRGRGSLLILSRLMPGASDSARSCTPSSSLRSHARREESSLSPTANSARKIWQQCRWCHVSSLCFASSAEQWRQHRSAISELAGWPCAGAISHPAATAATAASAVASGLGTLCFSAKSASDAVHEPGDGTAAACSATVPDATSRLCIPLRLFSCFRRLPLDASSVLRAVSSSGHARGAQRYTPCRFPVASKQRQMVVSQNPRARICGNSR